MKKFKLKIEGEENELFFSVSKYSNKRMAISVLDAFDGMPWMTLSHNFPESPEPEPGYFYAKYWSENSRTFMAMLRDGIIEPHKKEKESFYFSDNLLNRVCPMQFKVKDEYLSAENEEQNVYIPLVLTEEEVRKHFECEENDLDELPF